MNKPELTKLLTLIAAGYPASFIITPFTNELWEETIGGMDYELAKRAFKIYIKQGKDFPPNPGHIQKIAIDITTPIERKLTPAEVWERCVALACRGLSSIEAADALSDNPRAVSAVRQVGWDRIRYADIGKDLDFVRKDFVRYYSEMEERDIEEHEALALSQTASEMIQLASPRAIRGEPASTKAIGGGK